MDNAAHNFIIPVMNFQIFQAGEFSVAALLLKK
jgi:hypothetical protein